VKAWQPVKKGASTGPFGPVLAPFFSHATAARFVP